MRKSQESTDHSGFLICTCRKARNAHSFLAFTLSRTPWFPGKCGRPRRSALSWLFCTTLSLLFCKCRKARKAQTILDFLHIQKSQESAEHLSFPCFPGFLGFLESMESQESQDSLHFPGCPHVQNSQGSAEFFLQNSTEFCAFFALENACVLAFLTACRWCMHATFCCFSAEFSNTCHAKAITKPYKHIILSSTEPTIILNDACPVTASKLICFELLTKCSLTKVNASNASCES